MCQKCIRLAEEYFPHLNEGDRFKLLMEATAFPLAYPETLKQQLIDIRANTDGSLGQAMAYALRKT